jgi:anti-sigma regulatory factor (Ser/Thr protein kinase)
VSEAANDYRVDVLPELSDLSRAISLLDGIWREHCVDPDMQADLEIAIEEIISNIIRHGGGGEPIQLSVHVRPQDIRVEIRDQGVPLDPLKHPASDLNLQPLIPYRRKQMLEHGFRARRPLRLSRAT